MKSISTEEYYEAVDCFMGWCTNCEEFTRDSDTEPDAMNYSCPNCQKKSCVGAENALIMGLFDVEGE